MSLLRWTSVAGACLLAAAACSDTEFQPSKPITDAGADGTAGSGSGDAAIACKKDVDCDDNDPCTGTETCDVIAGTCRAGASPCPAAADPEHCEILCTNNAGKAECGNQTAKDSDGDGHRDSQCAASPGDDCDDTNKNVFPGATEVCDGLDGDCDGASDLEEGLPLAGTPFNVAAPAGADAVRPQAAWAPGTKSLGVVWTDFRGNAFQVFFSLFNETAAPVASDVVVSNTQIEAQNGVIASDGKTFGVAFVGEITGARHVFFRPFDLNGVPKSNPVQLSTTPVESDAGPGIVVDSPGYLVTWRVQQTADRVFARQVDAAGLAVASEAVIGSATAQRLWSHSVMRNGILGYLGLVAWSATGAQSATDLRVFTTADDFFEKYKGAPGTTSGSFRDPVLARVGARFSAAWAIPAGSFGFTQLLDTGNVDCGPNVSKEITAPVELGGLDGLGDMALAAVHMTTGGAQAEVHLARFDAKCQELATIDIAGAKLTPADSGPTFGSRTDVAVGDNKIAVVWDEKSGTNAVVKARIFGRNFCD